MSFHETMMAGIGIGSLLRMESVDAGKPLDAKQVSAKTSSRRPTLSHTTAATHNLNDECSSCRRRSTPTRTVEASIS